MIDRIALSDRAVAWALAEIFEAPDRQPIERTDQDMPLGPSVRARRKRRLTMRRGNNFDAHGLLERFLEAT